MGLWFAGSVRVFDVFDVVWTGRERGKLVVEGASRAVKRNCGRAIVDVAHCWHSLGVLAPQMAFARNFGKDLLTQRPADTCKAESVT